MAAYPPIPSKNNLKKLDGAKFKKKNTFKPTYMTINIYWGKQNDELLLAFQ